MIEHKMLHLFGGRMNAYGQDTQHGVQAVRGNVTDRLIRAHLEGIIGVGIYPMWFQNEIWLVKWGCCDIDTGDWGEAYGLATALQAMGFTPFVERSRSKGWHIWVFADGPVPAADMRRALKVAYAACDLQAREANPKAEHLATPDTLGNFVRLPFKGSVMRPTDRQTMMVDWGPNGDGRPVRATEWFDGFDQTMRMSSTRLQYWASKWVEPKKQHLVNPAADEETLRRLAGSMNPELLEFLKNGPRHGDRSEALVALAFKLKAQGYTPEERLGFVQIADRRWGKYYARPDGEKYLVDIVERTL